MNKKAALVAWQLVMERNRLAKLMTRIEREHDQAAYKEALAFVYAIVEPILEFPEPDGIEEVIESKGFVVTEEPSSLLKRDMLEKSENLRRDMREKREKTGPN